MVRATITSDYVEYVISPFSSKKQKSGKKKEKKNTWSYTVLPSLFNIDLGIW